LLTLISAILFGETIMPEEKLYTESEMREAFLCGVKQATNHDEGDPEPDYPNWIECMWLHGFTNPSLFDKPGFVQGPTGPLGMSLDTLDRLKEKSAKAPK
jgi:hypothetical protein